MIVVTLSPVFQRTPAWAGWAALVSVIRPYSSLLSPRRSLTRGKSCPWYRASLTLSSRLTCLVFREECIVTACQDGYVCTWARPGRAGAQQVVTALGGPPGPATGELGSPTQSNQVKQSIYEVGPEIWIGRTSGYLTQSLSLFQCYQYLVSAKSKKLSFGFSLWIWLRPSGLWDFSIWQFLASEYF